MPGCCKLSSALDAGDFNETSCVKSSLHVGALTRENGVELSWKCDDLFSGGRRFAGWLRKKRAGGANPLGLTWIPTTQCSPLLIAAFPQLTMLRDDMSEISSELMRLLQISKSASETEEALSLSSRIWPKPQASDIMYHAVTPPTTVSEQASSTSV